MVDFDKKMLCIVITGLILFQNIKAAPFMNCNDSLPMLLGFTFPDPMIITVGKPFHLIGSGIVKETSPQRFKVKHKFQRKFLGHWWTFPCIGEKFDHTKPFYELEGIVQKDCIHEMSCDEFKYFGYNGTCPIPPGNYLNYNLTIPVPYFPVPWWLTNGLYRTFIEAYDMDMKKLWFCGNLTQYFEQSKEDEMKYLAEVIV